MDIIGTLSGALPEKYNKPLIMRKMVNECKVLINHSFDDMELKFSDRDLRYINKNNVFSIHSSDPLAVFLYVSKKSHSLLGYSQEQIIGKSFYSFIHHDDLEEISNVHDKVLKGECVKFNCRIVKDEHEKRISAYLKKIDNIIITFDEMLLESDSIVGIPKNNSKEIQKLLYKV